MSTSSLIFPFIKTGDTSHHDISLETLPVLEATSIGLPNLRVEERPLPTYLSERSRPPSSVIHRNSEMSMPKDTFRLEHINISPISGSGSQNLSIEHHAHGDKSTSFVDAPVLPELTQITSTSNLPLSPRQRRDSIIQFLVLCWSVWLIGWNDGSTGPLLPRIQDNYQVGFTIVSMIFIANCIGYVSAGALNVWLNDCLGFGKVMVLGSICQLVAYAIMIPAPPFPLLLCAYLIAGFGISLQNAQANGFVSSLQQHMSTKLGMMHAAYGLGAFTSPFAATYFSGITSRRWAFHFIISAGFAVTNIIALIWVFRFRRQEEVMAEAGQEPTADSNGLSQGGNKYRQIFGLKAVHLLAVFALIYVGVEVTLGGWIVTFIIRERHGGHSTGYISSGFFGGLTLGRLCLMWLNKMVGERRVIVLYTLIAICLEFTIWFVPSIVGNAVAVSLIGLVLGPIFPLLVSQMAHIFPRWLLTGCVGLVTGIGIAGSAVLPFITGLLASKYGIKSLQPLMISMMGGMLLVWACVPKGTRRID